VFRSVERTEYGAAANQQLAVAQKDRGPGDLETLLRSGATWEVN
jgi:hypothetical protein